LAKSASPRIALMLSVGGTRHDQVNRAASAIGDELRPAAVADLDAVERRERPFLDRRGRERGDHGSGDERQDEQP
jgi:hypothetical protein